jgi:hypothetical protein
VVELADLGTAIDARQRPAPTAAQYPTRYRRSMDSHDIADVRFVVLRGGPLDGTEHLVSSQADYLDVTMADDTYHRYEDRSRSETRPGGRTVPVFTWSGRR